MTRTIVASDLHGQFRLLEAILEHSKFDGDNGDHLVIAGDSCDIGNQTMEIHEAAAALGAEELIGNHEISHMCSIDIRPYDVSLDPDYKAFIALMIETGTMKFAAEIDGVLITHAGLSKRLAIKGFTENGSEDSTFSTLHHTGLLTAKSAAKALNERLLSRVHIDHTNLLMQIDQDPMWTDWFYPLWFRPYTSPDYGAVQDCGFYDGFKQIVGHTPVGSFNTKQQRMIKDSGVTLTDPYVRKYFGEVGYCKYAVIEDGNVTLVKSH